MFDRYINKGKELLGPDWYNTEELREWFVRGLGEERGDAEWRDFITKIGATSTGSKVPQNIRMASFYRALGDDAPRVAAMVADQGITPAEAARSLGINVPDMPDYAGSIDSNDCAARKCTHWMALKKRNNVVNINAVLVDTFLNLIPVAFKQAYKQKRMENPNTVFREMFDWFVFKYGHTSAEDHEVNRTVMASEWHPSMGFELLAVHLFCGATFANLAKYPINGDDIVDIGIHVLH
jgi:hypothetical protein